MAYANFPNDQFFMQITADDEATPLCKVTLTDRTLLRHIAVHIQKVGAHTNETIQLEIHDQETVDTPMYVSDVYTYDDFSISASHYAGILTFDFDSVPLNPDIDYWIKARAGNYSYTDDSQYIAFAFDWPHPINTPDNADYPGVGVGIYGLKDL